ncbi:MAG TPA: heavy metal translocating P-type ATPase [bacterium]|nr:heavy metal translocating P-type ATPase [bacterium]
MESISALDPVCGMSVDVASPKGGSHVHAGRTYYFCSDHCRVQFAADPIGYLDGTLPESSDPDAIYTCPMDPEIEQKGPGSCPICGMALEPKDPASVDGGATLKAARSRFLLSALLAAPLAGLVMTQEWTGWHWPASPYGRLLQAALALPVVAWAGAPVFSKAATSLRTRKLNMYTLIGLGTGMALLYSLAALAIPGAFPSAFWRRGPDGPQLPMYFEAAAVITALVLLGEWLELRARGQTSQALKALLDLQARTARRLEADGSESEVDLALVRPGERLRVRPGETVPVDGEVLEGLSWVDESRMSGESEPLAKEAGDEVLGGTLNGQGSFVMEARRVGRDSLLGRIVAQVAEAQRSRAPIQRSVDRVSAVFVPAVVACAAASFMVWALWGPEPRLAMALLNAVTVLIVACPCALGLATPMSVMVGMGRAAQMGVLFRDAEALQALGTVDVLCLDKTGTLTEGRPALTAVVAGEGLSEAELLALAAGLERHSEHPLARAVLEAAQMRGLSPRPCEGFLSVAGQGVEGKVPGLSGGENLAGEGRLRIGTAAFCGISDFAWLERAESLRAEGATVFFVELEGRTLGLLAVADPVRATAQEALSRLQEAGLRLIVLSGDAEGTVKAVGRRMGLTELKAGLSPLDKAEAVRSLQSEGCRVAMAGDGVNDAPALAAATVGIAMGTGTDAAKLSAGVTLIRPDLRGILRARSLSRAVLRNISQNLWWALLYNSLGVPIAAGLLYPFTGMLLSPMYAAAAMSLSSLCVVGNALRLRRFEN